MRQIFRLPLLNSTPPDERIDWPAIAPEEIRKRIPSGCIPTQRRLSEQGPLGRRKLHALTNWLGNGIRLAQREPFAVGIELAAEADRLTSLRFYKQGIPDTFRMEIRKFFAFQYDTCRSGHPVGKRTKRVRLGGPVDRIVQARRVNRKTKP